MYSPTISSMHITFLLIVNLLLFPSIHESVEAFSYTLTCSLKSHLSSNGRRRGQTATGIGSSNSGNDRSNNNQNIQYIHGLRCLHVPPASEIKKHKSTPNPPVVLIGGIAQTISSWDHHRSALSKDRHLLIVECCGQGPRPPNHELNQRQRDDTNALIDPYDNVSLPFQANRVARVIRELFPIEDGSDQHEQGLVDVAGFSFGGRVAMALAASNPGIIRRMHITGIAARKDSYAEMMFWIWQDLLKDDGGGITMNDTVRLKSFAWSIILATYSDVFLANAGSRKVKLWVDHICQSNTADGILALLQQNHDTNNSVDENTDILDYQWDPLSMAQRIMESDSAPKSMMAVGSLDKMATIEQVEFLNTALGGEAGAIAVFDGSGHAVPMEKAREWRNSLIAFLNT